VSRLNEKFVFTLSGNSTVPGPLRSSGLLVEFANFHESFKSNRPNQHDNRDVAPLTFGLHRPLGDSISVHVITDADCFRTSDYHSIRSRSENQPRRPSYREVYLPVFQSRNATSLFTSRPSLPWLWVQGCHNLSFLPDKEGICVECVRYAVNKHHANVATAAIALAACLTRQLGLRPARQQSMDGI
jgi:hypothetical protein